MKRLSIVVLLLMLMPLSCYLDDTRSGRLSFMLSQLSDPSITSLHVAVYEGNDPRSATLLAYSVFRPNSVIDMTVPTGEDRVIAIWAETTPGNAKYYGASAPVDIDSGSTEKVDVQMWWFSDTTPVNDPVFQLKDSSSPITWNALYGADNYELQFNEYVSPSMIWVTKYYGPDTKYYTGATGVVGRVRAFSSLFNLTTEFSPFL